VLGRGVVDEVWGEEDIKVENYINYGFYRYYRLKWK